MRLGRGVPRSRSVNSDRSCEVGPHVKAKSCELGVMKSGAPLVAQPRRRLGSRFSLGEKTIPRARFWTRARLVELCSPAGL